MDGTGGLAAAQSFGEWLSACRDNGSPDTVRPGQVDATLFLAVEAKSGQLVGMIHIRHRLNDFLLRYGGNIGYSVRPGCRGRGYAKAMLAQALEFCRQRGMARVLVTCHKENTASARTILSNGGILENEVFERGHMVLRHWISL